MINRHLNWEPPLGLDRLRPREVRLTGNGIALLCCVGALLIGAVLSFVLITKVVHVQGEEQRLLREQGSVAQGVVTRVWRTSGESKAAWVSYVFSPSGRDVVIEGRSKIPMSLWRSLRAGSTIPVRFISSQPERNHPQAVEIRPTPVMLAPLTAGVLVVIASLLTLPLRTQRHLLVEGRPGPGWVTELKKTDKGTIVHFEYQVLSGAIRRGRSGPTRKPPQVGWPVVVIYDTDNPRQHGLYPLPLVRLRQNDRAPLRRRMFSDSDNLMPASPRDRSR